MVVGVRGMPSEIWYKRDDTHSTGAWLGTLVAPKVVGSASIVFRLLSLLLRRRGKKKTVCR